MAPTPKKNKNKSVETLANTTTNTIKRIRTQNNGIEATNGSKAKAAKQRPQVTEDKRIFS